jgi:hypothetical protein
MGNEEAPPTRNPNQGTEDEVDKTRWETVDTNAGPDAMDGGVANAEIPEPEESEGSEDQPGSIAETPEQHQTAEAAEEK